MCAGQAGEAGSSLLLGEQHSFGDGFGPSARLGTGGEEVLEGAECQGGEGPAELAVVSTWLSLPPVGEKPQPPIGARLGIAAQGRGCLSQITQSSNLDTHLPRNPSSSETRRTTMHPLACGLLLLQPHSLQEEKIKGLSIRLTRTSLLAAPGR